MSPEHPTTKPDVDAVLRQLERIVVSPDFDSSARAREFLRYVVGLLVSGREVEISQHAIAMTVFGRGNDFDPATDPIVRMQAGRVRRLLEHYYLTEGAKDPVLIALPKGTYVPVFQHRGMNDLSPSWAAGPRPPSIPTDSWPTVLLAPFRSLTSDPAGENLAQGLVWELASELNNYRELRFVLGGDRDDPRNREVDAQFELKGTVADGTDGLKISVQLLTEDAAKLVWARSYSTNCTGQALATFMDELARTLAAAIAAERGKLVQHYAQMPGRREAASPGAYEAILRYHHFARSPSHDAFRAAMLALQSAVRNYPDCGCCWSFLARLCTEDYALGISGNGRLIQEALGFARRGVQLAPTDQRARAVLSYVLLVNDQVEEARREAEAALALNPNSLFILEGIGYLLTLTGDWERGPELSRKAVRLNPFHMPVVHAGLWLDAIHRMDFEQAYRESLEFAPPELFWHPLMQAVALAFLGRRDEAAVQTGQLLKLKPDFLEHSQWLIRRYVKFDDLVERIEEGLSRAGLSIPADATVVI